MSDSPTVSRRVFEKAVERSNKQKAALARVKQESAKATSVLIRSVAGAGAAGAIGYMEGKAIKDGDQSLTPEQRLASTEIFNLPLSLVVAAGGTMVNIGGYAGDEQTSNLVQAVADGALAAYAYGKGREAGEPRAPAE